MRLRMLGLINIRNAYIESNDLKLQNASTD